MSITETPADERKKRRAEPRRKRAAAATPKAPKPAAELAGLTVTVCPTGCNAERCVISGKPYCAHPYKGGLQGRDMGDEAATGRLKAAKKLLGKRKIDLENA